MLVSKANRQRLRIISGVLVLSLFFCYDSVLRRVPGTPTSIAWTEASFKLGESQYFHPTPSNRLVQIPGVFPRPSFHPGVVKPAGQNYTRTLVVARTKDENVDWIEHELGDDFLLEKVIYTVDDDNEPQIPANKGHEVMVYLSYIIDHYDRLNDITIFIHAHQLTWHNNDLLDSNTATMVQRLSSPHVIRNGYMNLRCHLEPGCPDHIHPTASESDNTLDIPEAVIIGNAWKELFPLEPVPQVLSQPCCGQYALSRDRLRALPREQYIFFRQWLLATPLENRLSGRVWEYVWQYIWAGMHEFCPVENVCYCDGYGVCFGGTEPYAKYFEHRDRVRVIVDDLAELEGKEKDDGHPKASAGSHDETRKAETLRTERSWLESEMERLKSEAFERGMDPRSRALEVGRTWNEGDGY